MKQITLLNGIFIYFLCCSSILLGQNQTEKQTTTPSERVEEKVDAKVLENSTSHQSKTSSTLKLRDALKRAQLQRAKTRARKTDASATTTATSSQEMPQQSQRVPETVDMAAIQNEKAKLAAKANPDKVKEKPSTTTKVRRTEEQ